MTHHQRQFQGERASDLFSTLAFDPDSGLFQHDDQTLGFGFLCTPLAGVDAAYAERLSVLLNQDWPAGSLLQIGLWSTPDIDERLAVMLGLRLDLDDDVLREATRQRLAFLRDGVAAADRPRHRDPRARLVGVRLREGADRRRSAHSDPSWNKPAELRAGTEQILRTAGLLPRTLDADRYVRLMGTLLNWDAGQFVACAHRPRV